ncbi:hypothetical protein [Micromonospora rubida]|uniref:hypothetical protein n=1 Tax=Micromonospora rubida TaxID=2697657 RepID=UPI001377A9AC|nr:hypothetical protein [Micromonospora rubida]NBE82369.1 hypothetical protein [Micromonospora rubida]
MTSDTSTSPPPQGWHRRHSLVSRERLADEYEARYGSAAVSAYGLAVRDLVEGCPEIGAVDTWSRLAERICRDRPRLDRDAWRKRLSRHFTAETKGPPWLTVVLVVECIVPEADRETTFSDFARLYEAARGERPPSGLRHGTADPAHPDALDALDAEAGADRPDERTRTTIAHLVRENALLRKKLAANQAENELLRHALNAPARQAVRGSSRHRPLGSEARPEDVPRQRGSVPPVGPPRGGWNTGRFPAVPPAAGQLPATPATTNDAPAGRHRSPRLDQVWPTPRSAGPLPAYQIDMLPHAPGGVRPGRSGGPA